MICVMCKAAADVANLGIVYKVRKRVMTSREFAREMHAECKGCPCQHRVS